MENEVSNKVDDLVAELRKNNLKYVIILEKKNNTCAYMNGGIKDLLGMLEAERARARMNMLQKFSAQEQEAEDDRT